MNKYDWKKSQNRMVKVNRKEIIRFCERFSNIYVYGTGNIALEIVQYLTEEHIKCAGIIVSDKRRRFGSFMCIKVFEFLEIEYDNSMGIILALAPSSRLEVLENIKANGMPKLDNVYAPEWKIREARTIFAEIRINIRKILLGNQVQLNKFKVARFGNGYGGFDVTVDILSKTENPIIYSFGIGEDLSFSQDILRRYETANIYAFDPTPRAIAYVNQHELGKDERFHFYPIGIADTDGTVSFHLPTNPNHVSGSVRKHRGVKRESIDIEVKRLKTLMEELGHNKIDVLKMDIEGSEFNVIPDILNSGIGGCIDQLCLEIHDRFFVDGLIKWIMLKKDMNRAGFYIVSESKRKEEFTFLKM